MKPAASDACFAASSGSANADGRARVLCERRRIEFRTVAESDEEHALRLARSVQEHELTGRPFEFVRSQDVSDGAGERGVCGLRGAVEATIREDGDHEGPRAQRFRSA
jgi:hypothetical protein